MSYTSEYNRRRYWLKKHGCLPPELKRGEKPKRVSKVQAPVVKVVQLPYIEPHIKMRIANLRF